MTKIITLIFLLIFLTSLTYMNEGLAGEYLNENKRERFSLKLRPDSTFIQEVKSCITHTRVKGTWSTKKDTLILNVKRIKELNRRSSEQNADFKEKFLISSAGLSWIWINSKADSVKIGQTLLKIQ